MRQWRYSGFLVIGLAACDAPGEARAPAEVVTEQAALIGNDVVTAANDPVGLGTYGSRGTCTATRLSDYWVLTAGHCGVRSYLRDGTFTTVGREQIPVARAYVHPVADAALLRLSRPPSGAAFKNGFFRNDRRSLIGMTLTCFGRGPNVMNGPLDTMRRANLRVATATDARGGTFLTEWPADPTQPHTFRGDSGGACFIDINGQPFLAGILMHGPETASTDGTPVRSEWASVEAFRDWAYAIMTGELAPTEAIIAEHNHLQGIVSVLDSRRSFVSANAMFLPDESASSIRLGSMLEVRLYDGPGFRDPFRLFSFSEYQGSFSDPSVNWENRTSSALPLPRSSVCPDPQPDEVTVWADANFQGPCDVLKPGSFDEVGHLRVGNGITSLKVGGQVTATLYVGSGFEEPSGIVPFPVTSNTSQLMPAYDNQVRSMRIHDRACSAPRLNQVTVYQHADYRGFCRTFTPEIAHSGGALDRDISSVQVGPHARLALFDDINYRGARQNLNFDHPFFPALGWNDRARSLIVRRSLNCNTAPDTVTFWRDANFQGRCVQLGVGQHQTREQFVLDVHELTSYQVGAQVRVRLFEHEGGMGMRGLQAPLSETASLADLTTVPRPPSPTDTWNDHVSSVEILPR